MKFTFLLIIIFLLSSPLVILADETVNITATVSGCGDELISFGEDCDGVNLNGESCESRGFVSGTLSCFRSCVFNTSNCESKEGVGVIFNNPINNIVVNSSDLINNASFRAGVVERLTLVIDGFKNLLNSLTQINSNPSITLRTSPSTIASNIYQVVPYSSTHEVVSTNQIYNEIGNVRVRLVARLRIFLFELRQMFGWIFPTR